MEHSILEDKLTAATNYESTGVPRVSTLEQGLTVSWCHFPPLTLTSPGACISLVSHFPRPWDPVGNAINIGWMNKHIPLCARHSEGYSFYLWNSRFRDKKVRKVGPAGEIWFAEGWVLACIRITSKAFIFQCKYPDVLLHVNTPDTLK